MQKISNLYNDRKDLPNVYLDHPGMRYLNHDDAEQYVLSSGYKKESIVGALGCRSVDYILIEIDNFDEKLLPAIKNDEFVFRAISNNMIAGKMMTFLKVNPLKKKVQFMDLEKSEDKVVFHRSWKKFDYLRFIGERVGF